MENLKDGFLWKKSRIYAWILVREFVLVSLEREFYWLLVGSIISNFVFSHNLSLSLQTATNSKCGDHTLYSTKAAKVSNQYHIRYALVSA